VKARDLVSLPWTIRGPRQEDDCWIIRIDELPDFLVAGWTRDAVLSEYTPALEAFLASYIEHGEFPPVLIGRLWEWLALAYQPLATAILRDAS